AGLVNKVPNVFRLAQSLGLGTINLFANAEWVPIANCCCGAGFTAKLKVTIFSSYNGVVIQSWSATSEENYDCQMTRSPAWSFVLCDWDFSAPCCHIPLRAKFENDSLNNYQVQPSMDSAKNSARQDIDNRFRALQKTLYARTASAFSSANNIQDAAQELDGSKQLL